MELFIVYSEAIPYLTISILQSTPFITGISLLQAFYICTL